MANSENQELVQFMEDEIKRTRRRVNTSYIIGIILAIFVGCYMGFILYMEKTFLEPKNLAFLVASEVEKSMPAAFDDAEKALSKQAWDGAEALSNRFVELVPQFTQVGKEHIDLVSTDLIPYLNMEIDAMVRDYIQENAADLEAFATNHNSEEFAQYFTDEIMTQFAVKMNEYLAAVSDGHGLNYVEENTTIALDAMNQAAQELLDADPSQMSQTERLQRRLIARLTATAMGMN